MTDKPNGVMGQNQTLERAGYVPPPVGTKKPPDWAQPGQQLQELEEAPEITSLSRYGSEEEMKAGYQKSFDEQWPADIYDQDRPYGTTMDWDAIPGWDTMHPISQEIMRFMGSATGSIGAGAKAIGMTDAIDAAVKNPVGNFVFKGLGGLGKLILTAVDIGAEIPERTSGLIHQIDDAQKRGVLNEWAAKDFYNAWRAAGRFYDVSGYSGAPFPWVEGTDEGMPGVNELVKVRELLNQGKTWAEVDQFLQEDMGAMYYRGLLADGVMHTAFDLLIIMSKFRVVDRLVGYGTKIAKMGDTAGEIARAGSRLEDLTSAKAAAEAALEAAQASLKTATNVADQLRASVGAVEELSAAQTDLARASRAVTEATTAAETVQKEIGVLERAIDKLNDIPVPTPHQEKLGRFLNRDISLDPIADAARAADGVLRDDATLWKPWTWFRWRPETKAMELYHRVGDHAAAIVNVLGSPELIVRVLTEPMRALELPQLGTHIFSMQGRALRWSLQGSAAKLGQLLDAWNGSVKMRSLTNAMAQVLSTSLDETVAMVDKLTPDELVAKMRQALQAAPPPGTEMSFARIAEALNHPEDFLRTLNDISEMYFTRMVPYDLKGFRMEAVRLVQETTAQQAIILYGIQPNGHFAKSIAALKAAETLAYLRLNPAYPVRNALNNELTMYARGVWNALTDEDIVAYWNRIGFEPSRLGEGFGSADQALRSAREFAKGGEATVVTGEDLIVQAIKGKSGFLDRVARKIQGVNLGKFDAGGYAKDLERMASRRAYTAGMTDWIGGTWKPKKGFDTLVDFHAKKHSAVSMDATAPHFRGLEERIVDCRNAKELDELLTADLPFSMEQALGATAKQLGRSTDDLRNVLGSEAVESLSRDLKAAFATGDREKVMSVFDNFEARAQDHIDGVLQEQLDMLVDRAASRMKATGDPTELLWQMDEMQSEAYAFNEAHLASLNDRVALIQRLPTDAQPKAWDSFFAQNQRHFDRLQQRLLARREGMVRAALRYGVPVNMETTKPLDDLIQATQNFYSGKTKAWKLYVAGERSADTYKIARSSIDTLYSRLIKQTLAAHRRMDKNIYSLVDTARPGMGRAVRAWRATVADVRKAYMEDVRRFYLIESTAEEAVRRAEWAKFNAKRVWWMNEIHSAEVEGYDMLRTGRAFGSNNPKMVSRETVDAFGTHYKPGEGPATILFQEGDDPLLLARMAEIRKQNPGMSEASARRMAIAEMQEAPPGTVQAMQAELARRSGDGTGAAQVMLLGVQGDPVALAGTLPKAVATIPTTKGKLDFLTSGAIGSVNMETRRVFNAELTNVWRSFKQEEWLDPAGPLATGRWGVIESLDMDGLADDLAEMGYAPIRITGRYQMPGAPAPETNPAYFVPGMRSVDGWHLGHKHGQNAVFLGQHGDLEMKNGQVLGVDWKGVRQATEADPGAMMIKTANGEVEITIPDTGIRTPWKAELEGPHDVVHLEVDVQNTRLQYPTYYHTPQGEIASSLRKTAPVEVSDIRAHQGDSMVMLRDGKIRTTEEDGVWHSEIFRRATDPDLDDVERMGAELQDMYLYEPAQWHASAVRIGYGVDRQTLTPTVVLVRNPSPAQWDTITDLLVEHKKILVHYSDPFGRPVPKALKVALEDPRITDLKQLEALRDPMGRLDDIPNQSARSLLTVDPDDPMVGATSFYIRKGRRSGVPYRVRGTGPIETPPGTTRVFTKIKRGDIYDLVDDPDNVKAAARAAGKNPQSYLEDTDFFRGTAADPNQVFGWRSQTPTQDTFFQGGEGTSWTPGYHYRETGFSSEDLRSALYEAWANAGGKLTREQANDVVALMDARAEVWARSNPGMTKDDWYMHRIAGIDHVVDDASLLQNMPRSEYLELLKENGLASPEMTLQLLGRHRPEYLDETVKFLVERRGRLAAGQMNERDVLRSWAVTVASQNAGPQEIGKVQAVWREAGIDIEIRSQWLVKEPGKAGMYIRPEDAMSAWMLSPNGKRFFNQLAKGDVDAKLMAEFVAIRTPFGAPSVLKSALRPASTGKLGMLDFATKTKDGKTFLQRMNELVPRLKEEGAQDEFLRLMQELSGVGGSKDAFVSSMLGMGTRVTLDTNEIMYWIGGTGKVVGGKSSAELASWLARKSIYRGDPNITQWLRTGIQGRFKGLRAVGVGADVPEEVFMEVMHHWLFDAVRGSETTHDAWYAAARLNQKGGRAIPKGAVTFLEDGRAVIHALGRPDFSTAVHELAHILRRHDLSGADLKTVEDWLGVRKTGVWAEAHEERFARAFELYIREGHAPTAQLKGVFERAKDWMRRIYRSIKGGPLDVDMSNDVRRVFDRMFGSDVPDDPLRVPGGGLTRQQLSEMIPDEAPMGASLDELWFKDGRNILADMRGQVAKQFDNPRPLKQDFAALSDAQKGVVRDYLDHVKRQQSDMMAAGMRYAEVKRDAALLNYHHRTHFDHYMGMIMPFQFWTTHSAWNWMLWTWNKPWIMAGFMRYMNIRKKLPRTMPARFDGMMPLGQFPFMPNWLGPVFVNPLGSALPFDLWSQPFETVEARGISNIQRTEREIQRMAQTGQLEEGVARQAITERSGAIWDAAAEKVAQNSDELDPLDAMQGLISPHAPLVWGWHLAHGQPERIGPFLPITRTIKGLTALLGVPGGVNIEGPLRKAMGLPAFDQWDEYRAERMVANMVALKEVGVTEGMQALSSHEGEVWQEAVRRAGIEYGVAAVSSGMFGVPMRPYPPGEEKSRWLVDQLGKAYEAEREGKEGAVEAFFEKYPEVQTRLALNDEPEQKMRMFLTDQVWDKWNGMTSLEKRAVTEALGPEFERAFLDKETRSSEIPVDMLEGWLAAMSKDGPPGVYTGTAVKWPDPAIANRAQIFYDERKRLFGDSIWDVQDGFFKETTQAGRNAYKKAHPELAAYWTWRRGWLEQNPSVAPYIEEDPDKLPKLKGAALAQAQATEPNLSWETWSRVVDPPTFRLVFDAVRTGTAPSDATMASLGMVGESLGLTDDEVYQAMHRAYLAR